MLAASRENMFASCVYLIALSPVGWALPTASLGPLCNNGGQSPTVFLHLILFFTAGAETQGLLYYLQ